MWLKRRVYLGNPGWAGGAGKKKRRHDGSYPLVTKGLCPPLAPSSSPREEFTPTRKKTDPSHPPDLVLFPVPAVTITTTKLSPFLFPLVYFHPPTGIPSRSALRRCDLAYSSSPSSLSPSRKRYFLHSSRGFCRDRTRMFYDALAARVSLQHIASTTVCVYVEGPSR